LQGIRTRGDQSFWFADRLSQQSGMTLRTNLEWHEKATCLMVPLFQGLLRQSAPTFSTVDRFGSFESNIKVTTLDS